MTISKFRKPLSSMLLLLTLFALIASISFQSRYAIAQSHFDYVDSTSVLPWTGLGADYLLYYDNQDATVWTSTHFQRDGVWYYGHVDLVNYWKPLFHQVKLGFTFPYETPICSYYEYEKMNAVVQMFYDRDARVIPALYPRWDSAGVIGSDKLKQDWVGFTRDFLGDQRIAAFNIFGEPVGQSGEKATDLRQWHSSMQENRKLVLLYFVEIINAIHSIDSDRVVIFPFMGLSYWNQNELISDLEGTGMLENPKVIFDIVHPYYFERPEWNEGTPAQKAIMYKNQFIIPWVNRLPSNRLWCGETFCFSAPVSETHYNNPTRSLQVDFMINMLNIFVEYKIGFILWDSLSYPPYYTSPQQTFSQADAHIESVESSNYGGTYIGQNNDPTPSPTSTPTPSPPPTSTPIPSPTPTSTPTSTPTPLPTTSPSPTPTPTPSSSPVPTPSPLPSLTPSPTSNPKPTPDTIPSPKPASTPIPTPNSTPTPTHEIKPEKPLHLPPLSSDRRREFIRYGRYIRYVRY